MRTHCPYCGGTDSSVSNTRFDSNRDMVKRRRECTTCKQRWSTYEVEKDRLSLMEDVMKQGYNPSQSKRKST